MVSGNRLTHNDDTIKETTMEGRRERQGGFTSSSSFLFLFDTRFLRVSVIFYQKKWSIEFDNRIYQKVITNFITRHQNTWTRLTQL